MNTVIDVSQLSTKTQQILPELLSLPQNERSLLIEALKNVPAKSKEISNTGSKNRLGNHFLKVVGMSDDFTDELSDDFWLSAD